MLAFLIVLNMIIVSIALAFIFVRVRILEKKIDWVARVIYPTEYVFGEIGFKLGEELRDLRRDNAINCFLPLSEDAKRLYFSSTVAAPFWR
jgi:ABC-type polysaccharide/polyol phosphate export permease